MNLVFTPQCNTICSSCLITFFLTQDLIDTYQVHGSRVLGCTFPTFPWEVDSSQTDSRSTIVRDLWTKVHIHPSRRNSQHQHSCTFSFDLCLAPSSKVSMRMNHSLSYLCQRINLAVGDEPVFLLHAVLFYPVSHCGFSTCNGEVCKQV